MQIWFEDGIEYFRDATVPAQRESNEINWITDPTQGFAVAKAQGKPIMIDFYTDWCGWCKKLDSDVYPDKEVIQLSSRFIMLKLNADNYRDEAARYSVQGFPTMVFLDSTGREITRQVGYCSAAELSSLMNKITH